MNTAEQLTTPEVAFHAAGSPAVWVRYWSWLLGGLYAGCALLLFPHYQDKLYPDTISYISIARKYLEGDVANAVNAYWAPMLSWAMVPFLRLGFDPLESIKLVSIVAGVGTILAAGRLFESFPISPADRRLTLLALVPAVFYFSMSMATPDLLLAASLTAYFAVIFRDDYDTNRTLGFWCGAFAGLAYLSKHYALPFFLIHFTVLNAWHYTRSARKRTVVLNAGVGVVTCAVIVLPWVMAMAAKYDRVTIGTSGARTYAYVGPHSRGDTLGPRGLVAPPNPTATSAWEEPSFDMLESWSPLESREHLRHQGRILVRHLRMAGVGLLSFSPLSGLLLATYVVAGIGLVRIRKAGLPLFTMALYTAGYLSVWMEVRYLWPLCVLLVLMAGMLLTAMRSFLPLSQSLRRAAVAVCLGSFVLPPIVSLIREFDSGRQTRELADTLKRQYGVGGKIAAHNQYKAPLYLSYYLGGQFFGTSDRTLPESRIEELILESGIDYYFVWTAVEADDQIRPAFLTRYREITGGALSDLRIYAMKPVGAPN